MEGMFTFRATQKRQENVFTGAWYTHAQQPLIPSVPVNAPLTNTFPSGGCPHPPHPSLPFNRDSFNDHFLFLPFTFRSVG
jgi:hypothetical protein